MHQWVLAGTTFLASAVELVEAATIVLAVGYGQGWRPALLGTAYASAALVAIVALFGPLLGSAHAVRVVELIVGPFLVLFGIGWLRKAVWRFAGRKALHDEQAIYDRELARLRADREHRLGLAVAFQGVFLEGLEVAVIVVTFAATRPGQIAWTVGGALAAFVVVAAAALALHRPFARVPENAMKAVVGTMLLSLGTLWTGEALGLQWWAGDATLFAIAACYVATGAVATLALRMRGRAAAA